MAGSSPDSGMRGGLSVGKMVFLGLLCVAGYAGYSGYCRHKANEKHHAFSQLTLGLRNELLRINRPIRPADIQSLLTSFAQKTDVTLVGSAAVTIEPLTSDNQGKLSSIVQRAMGMTSKLKRHRRPRWLVGFRGRFDAKHGVATVRSEHERYTYFESVAETSGG